MKMTKEEFLSYCEWFLANQSTHGSLYFYAEQGILNTLKMMGPTNDRS